MTSRHSPHFSTRLRVLAPISVGTGMFMAPARRSVAQNQTGDSFTKMASLLPKNLTAAGEGAFQLTFADIAAQIAAARVIPPDNLVEDLPKDWINAITPLAIADPFAAYFRDITRDMVGFDLLDIDQTLQASAPPGIVTLLRGRFDHAAIAGALTAQGYASIKAGELDALSLHEDDSIDISNQINQIAFSKMNNAAFLSDGTLAFAPTKAMLESVVEVATANVETLTADADFAGLLTEPFLTMASCIIVPGSLLTTGAMVDPTGDVPRALIDKIDEQLAASGAMSPIAWGLFGIEPGAVPNDLERLPDAKEEAGTMVFRLSLQKPGTAATAAAVMHERLGSMDSKFSGHPFADFFSAFSATPSSDGKTLTVELRLGTGTQPNIYMSLLYRRDLLFLAWPGQ